MKVAVLALRQRPEAVAAARRATTWLRERKVEVREGDLDEPATLPRLLDGVAAACVFGGDGTMLRAARLLAPHGVGLLGVNLGRRGFLTVASVEELPALLEDVLRGDYHTEERLMLEATLRRDGNVVDRSLALNDVVVARGAAVRSIHVTVRIDGDEFTTYWADGLIVATATGSTAYAFSVGGPVILPSARALLFVPIAPHLSFRNAVVLDEGQRLRLVVHDEPARLSVDGQHELDLGASDEVEVAPAAVNARFLRTERSRPFLALLHEKILKEGRAI